MDEGRKLKERRERLGKDEKWIEEILAALVVPRGANGGQHGLPRRMHVEDPGSGDICYSHDQTAMLRAAYVEALDVAERTQGEPRCPDDVEASPYSDGDTRLCVRGAGGFALFIKPDGCVTTTGVSQSPCSPSLLRYAAALSEHLAEVHAERVQQRVLVEVKAAEDAYQAAHDAYARAEEAMTEAATALRIAREKAAC